MLGNYSSHPKLHTSKNVFCYIIIRHILGAGGGVGEESKPVTPKPFTGVFVTRARTMYNKIPFLQCAYEHRSEITSTILLTIAG